MPLFLNVSLDIGGWQEKEDGQEDREEDETWVDRKPAARWEHMKLPLSKNKTLFFPSNLSEETLQRGASFVFVNPERTTARMFCTEGLYGTIYFIHIQYVLDILNNYAWLGLLLLDPRLTTASLAVWINLLCLHATFLWTLHIYMHVDIYINMDLDGANMV